MRDWHFAHLNRVIKISLHIVRYLSENLKEDKEPAMWLCWEKESQAEGMALAKTQQKEEPTFLKKSKGATVVKTQWTKGVEVERWLREIRGQGLGWAST